MALRYWTSVPLPYAVMYLLLGCGQVGIFLISNDYGDHAVTKWNQFQQCMMITTLSVRTENIRKSDFSHLSDIKISASWQLTVFFFHNAKNFFHSAKFRDELCCQYYHYLFHMTFWIFRWPYMQKCVTVRWGNCGGHIEMSCFDLPINIDRELGSVWGQTSQSFLCISLHQWHIL